MSQGLSPRGIPWGTLQRWAWGVGLVGLALWGIAWGVGAATGNVDLLRQVFFAYLMAFGFCLSIPLGSSAIWLLHNMTGGAWGLVIRRYLEAATRVVPFLALLFVPIFFGLPWLYAWDNPELVDRLHHGHEIAEVLAKRGNFLTAPFFIGRACLYFLVWTFVAWMLDRRQRRIERDPADRRLARRQLTFSGPAVLLYGLGMTFAAIDWFMTLEPTWYSTIFGVLIIMGQTLPALAFAIGTAAWLHDRKELAPVERDRETWNDLGNLLLAAVMLWTYMALSQLLLIWIGNLPEEITWYVKRSNGGWEWVAWLLGVGYFAVPFALLLSRRNKREPRTLLTVAGLLVFMDAVNYFWLVQPVYAAILNLDLDRGGPFTISWLNFAALAGLGGVTFALFLWQLRARPLTPPPLPLAETESAVGSTA